MIIDKISKMDRYAYIPGVQKAVDFLKNTNLTALEKGTIDLGDGHCVKVMFYDTKPLPEEDISLEAHRNYLDLQMTFGGEETMYFQAIDLGEEDKPYNQEKDVEFFKTSWTHQVVLNPENFALIFPNDLHVGGYDVDKTDKVNKLVFKLKID